MNILSTNPDAARAIARQTISERVRDAEERRIARTVRDQRRASARALRRQQVSRDSASRWSFRFLHPAH
jgi:hypothetical protein